MGADSPLHRWDARWKLGGLLALAAGTAVVSRPGPAAVALGIGLVLCLLARLPSRDVLARVGLLLVPSAPLVLLLPLTADTAAAGTFALKLLAAGLFALVLGRTGSPDRLFAALGAIGAPRPLVQVGRLSHRFAGLFADDLRRLRRAWAVRGFRPATTVHAARTVGSAVGALAVRADERAGRVAAALRARGFDALPRPLDPFQTRWGDVAGFAACAAAAVGLVWLGAVGQDSGLP